MRESGLTNIIKMFLKNLKLKMNKFELEELKRLVQLFKNFIPFFFQDNFNI